MGESEAKDAVSAAAQRALDAKLARMSPQSKYLSKTLAPLKLKVCISTKEVRAAVLAKLCFLFLNAKGINCWRNRLSTHLTTKT